MCLCRNTPGHSVRFHLCEWVVEKAGFVDATVLKETNNGFVLAFVMMASEMINCAEIALSISIVLQPEDFLQHITRHYVTSRNTHRQDSTFSKHPSHDAS